MTASPMNPTVTRPARGARRLSAVLALILALLVLPVIGGAWFFYSTGLDELRAHVGQEISWLTLLIIVPLLVSVVGAFIGLLRWQETSRVRERLEAERAQAWLHEVIARSLNEIYVFDPGSLRFRLANRGACRNVGYTHDELATRTPLDLAPRLTEEAFRALLTSLRGGDPPVVEFDTIHRRKDGSEYPVEVRLQLVDTGKGELALAIVNDVTEQRGLEAERERLLAAIEQSADAILVLDCDTTIRYANRAVLAISGYERDELYGEKAGVFAGPDATEENPDGWCAIIAGGRSGTLAIHAKDGRALEAEWTIAQIRDVAGTLAGYVAIARDRSKERALEAQVARIQKMEAIGQLGAGIAHDFNNILTTAGGFAQLLRDQVPAADPMRVDLDQIVAATERGATLVRQILAFSRRQVLEPGVVDLNGLVEGIAPMLGRLLGEHVEVTLALESHLGHMKADPGQIEQVIMNLAVNARDAMPGGGQLSIKTANVELDDAYTQSHPGVAPGPYVQLAVSDTGGGMDAATLEHMFEPFFTTKGPDKGTGLGLATVHGIVNQSGGHVWAYSEPGHGTCFKTYFPRVDERAAPYVAPRPSGAVGRGSETILLVEDEEAVRVLATRALEQQGYRVLAMASPADALELLAGDAPAIDLLVTDVILPGMEGPELVQRLEDRLPGLRALFVSGYAEQSFIIPGLDGAGRAFLPKPYSLQALAREIRELLDAAAA